MVGHVPEHLRRWPARHADRQSARAMRRRWSKSYQDAGCAAAERGRASCSNEAEAQLFDRFWGMSMSELRKVDHGEMRQFAIQFRDLMYEMPFQLPHNLLLLGRTIAILSGMCTGLDPNFNLWKQLAPYATKLIADEGGSNWQVWLDQIGEFVKEAGRAARTGLQSPHPPGARRADRERAAGQPADLSPGRCRQSPSWKSNLHRVPFRRRRAL